MRATAGATVKVVLPEIAPDVAVITLEPAACATAIPPGLIIVAVAVVPLVQVALVRTCVELSEKCPVATKSTAIPTAAVGVAGVTVIETRLTPPLLTVSTAGVVLVIAPKVAVMFEVPAATAVARPAESIVATEVVAEFQVTWPVMSVVVELLNVPVAVNC